MAAPSKARIIFMGTPEFAVSTLDAMVSNGYNIVGVVTAPDKPAGRGMKTTMSAVKKFAIEKGLPILQPEKLKNPEFVARLQELHADLQVVVAFRMLPEIVWNMPPLGTINVHASLLPDYRGAAPINWAIINGEKKTGITTFKLSQEIDTGNILLQKEVEINDDETAGELHDKLKTEGATLLLATLQEMFNGTITEKYQTDLLTNGDLQPKLAPKIFTDTCRIDWNTSTERVYNLIRGLSPYPAAFTSLNGKLFKIYIAEKKPGAPNNVPGSVETDNRTFLRFACTDGYIYATDVQAEGKKRIKIEEFLRGFREK